MRRIAWMNDLAGRRFSASRSRRTRWRRHCAPYWPARRKAPCSARHTDTEARTYHDFVILPAAREPVRHGLCVAIVHRPRETGLQSRKSGEIMQRGWLLVATLSVVATIACADNGDKGKDKDREKVEPQVAQYFKDDDTGTDNSVAVEGSSVGYHAIAGTIIIHPKGWDD